MYIGHQSVGNAQSGEVEESVPVTDPSQGIMRRIDIELPVGQYRVYVRAENEFGNSTSVISDVSTITSSYACTCAFVSILLHLHNILCSISSVHSSHSWRCLWSNYFGPNHHLDHIAYCILLLQKERNK